MDKRELEVSSAPKTSMNDGTACLEYSLVARRMRKNCRPACLYKRAPIEENRVNAEEGKECEPMVWRELNSAIQRVR